MLLLIRFAVTLIVVMVIWNTIPGLIINNVYEAVVFAVILSALNSIVRPVLVILTLPITILTLGLFTAVINIFTFWLASTISYGVHIETISAAVWGGLIMWVTGMITNRYIWHVNIY